MKLEKQIGLTNLKLSKKLKELGVKQESNYRWVRNISSPNYLTRDGKWLLVDGCEPNSWEDLKADTGGYSTKKEYEEYLSGFVSAFTVAELGISNKAITYGIREDGTCWARVDMSFLTNRKWSPEDNAKEVFEAKTEANVRAKMLIYLRENKLMKA